MENKIFNDIIEARKGHYCHVLEVEDIESLIDIIENLFDEFIRKYTLKDIIEFFNTIEVYSLNELNDNEIYQFNIENYIKTL